MFIISLYEKRVKSNINSFIESTSEISSSKSIHSYGVL